MTRHDSFWPDLAGRFEGDMHVLPVRIYYEDTDFSGAVYHANYLKFCERARSDCLRLIGIDHSDLAEGRGRAELGFVVRRLLCDFLKPARIDDVLTVETRFESMGGARLELGQQIKRDEELIFRAKVMVALVDGAGRPQRIPEAMVQAIETARGGVTHS
jgi:acyl-CoA thioester hydrolase